MSEIVISLQNVSKCYKQYARPVDRLKELILPGKVRADEFWALQNISLEVSKGQTLGIVGRNGSGKSTLLQIVVGTLAPTSGQVAVTGRISALLELGSGFNPEFTGRQNVFFNGQLLGLSHQEIEEKFDEIAAFADIGNFIDQPVKTYSSGMFVRLAFAVAINVNPDIFVVDEALSVGDEAFQRKCFARIQAIQDRGGTILFVSHAASSVIKLCNSAILIDSGELLLHQAPKSVITQYQKLIYAPSAKTQALREEIRRLNNDVGTYPSQEGISSSGQLNYLPIVRSRQDRFKEFYDPDMVPTSTITYISRGVTISNFCITTLEGKAVNHLIGRNDYIYTYSILFSEDAHQVKFGMLIKTINGHEIGGASFPIQAIHHLKAGTKIRVKFQFKCLFHPGTYFLNAGVVAAIEDDITFLARHVDAAMFKVQPENDLCGTGVIDLLIEPSFVIETGLTEEREQPEEKRFDLSTNSY